MSIFNKIKKIIIFSIVFLILKLVNLYSKREAQEDNYHRQIELNLVVSAIDKFYLENKSYPYKLYSLVPDYLKELPIWFDYSYINLEKHYLLVYEQKKSIFEFTSEKNVYNSKGKKWHLAGYSEDVRSHKEN